MLVKALRKIIDGNKGIFTFWLIVVFLGVLCIKNTTAVPTVKSAKAQVAHLYCKSDLTGIYDDNYGTGFFDKLEKDFDSDDVEFIFFGNLHSQLFSFSGAKLFIPAVDFCKQSYNSSLYDLYCNWKFHLS